MGFNEGSLIIKEVVFAWLKPNYTAEESVLMFTQKEGDYVDFWPAICAKQRQQHEEEEENDGFCFFKL